jgi:alkylation response protein AidB-like acyl-CoA dehydrogenase
MRPVNIFAHSEALMEKRARMRDFVDREAIPREHADLTHDIEKLDRVARLLRQKAKAAGLYAPQLPTAYGGLGLSWCERAVILEEAGRSFLGPLAINCAPPDQPNMINLILNGSPDQRVRYLEPLIRGDIRSCFAMTEPAPGAGSDPSMLKTRGHAGFVDSSRTPTIQDLRRRLRAAPGNARAAYPKKRPPTLSRSRPRRSGTRPRPSRCAAR